MHKKVFVYKIRLSLIRSRPFTTTAFADFQQNEKNIFSLVACYQNYLEFSVVDAIICGESGSFVRIKIEIYSGGGGVRESSSGVS